MRSRSIFLVGFLGFLFVGCGGQDAEQPPVGSITIKANKDEELPLKGIVKPAPAPASEPESK